MKPIELRGWFCANDTRFPRWYSMRPEVQLEISYSMACSRIMYEAGLKVQGKIHSQSCSAPYHEYRVDKWNGEIRSSMYAYARVGANEVVVVFSHISWPRGGWCSRTNRTPKPMIKLAPPGVTSQAKLSKLVDRMMILSQWSTQLQSLILIQNHKLHFHNFHSRSSGVLAISSTLLDPTRSR